ncbi:hypothetical protein BOTNAR_0175g00150 [Botryotinia narcissicola]|uniref:Major facilitator superfamily (MFS) profile domain-containing protein n=1 Tax=Botryotinia narcissicola TaxID=278944 RepID=A0A4Z1IDN4_9HELO|nr:hypothetical protein BOTNAR_0175g00150 [Botryotinia narcissicola]
MIEDTRIERANGNGAWKDLFAGGFHRGSNLYRTFIGTMVQMMQQLTGVNFIFYYGTTYFAQVGLTSFFLLATITNIVNVASTPISFWTIERFGRRPLLIYGGIFMSICEFIIAIVGTVLTESKAAQWVLFVFVLVHIFFFASTWGPTAWAVSGEMFPLALRGRGVALSTASNWFWNFIIAFVTPYLVGEENANLKAKVFFIFGATGFLSALFAYVFIYETKGQSLESIDRMCADPRARDPRHSHECTKNGNGVMGAGSTGADVEAGQGVLSQRTQSKQEEAVHLVEKENTASR